jgi:hypothetical protein
MELIVSKLNHHHEGLKVALNDGDTVQNLTIINGNQPDFLGPVILLSLDQHIVYGMSHPEVISRIFTKGPQQLLTSKEIAHNLFEHGMKATLGKIKIKLNWFITTLDTFYTLTSATSMLQIIPGKDNKLGCLITPMATYQSILLCNPGFEIKEPEKYNISESIEIDNIKTYVSTPIKVKNGYH